MKSYRNPIAGPTRMNARLLAALKAGAGQWIMARDLGRGAGLAGLRLRRDVQRLRDLGFVIDEEPARFRLAHAPDVLLAEEIRGGLDTRVIGREVIVCERVESTNDAAWELARWGAAEGTAVLAEEQTRGRGRMGRNWHSPRGGLWMSIILNPATAADRATVLTMAASVAVAKAIRELAGCHATIRWPNDILVGGLKVAGLMVETHTINSPRETSVLGIGVDVNCTQFPEEIATMATSLALQTGRDVRRADLARLVFRLLDERYLQLCRGEIAPVGEEWMAMSSTLGQRITILQNGRTYTGEVVDIDPEAGLMVRLDRGFVRAFKNEHVTVVK